MSVEEVSRISKRMIFLKIYEVLAEANQSVVLEDGEIIDTGYPFCYFTGSVLFDLLAQKVFWQGQGITLLQALTVQLPDIDQWLSSSIQNMDIDDFFNWQPHTLKVQELVDDVKQRVLEVMDAVHAAERLQSLSMKPQRIELVIPGLQHQMITAGVNHSTAFRSHNNRYIPIITSASINRHPQWQAHALIHGLWLVTACGGYLKVDTKAYKADLESRQSHILHDLL